MSQQIGVLLINLGTPDDTSIRSVRRYLAEFLADARVIDLPWPLRYAILYGFILPFRPRQTSHAYQSIWSEQGSPLLVNSQNITKALQSVLSDNYTVRLAMRYGNPSIKSVMPELLAECDELMVIPLYPQYAASTSSTSIAEVMSYLSDKWDIPSVHAISSFYEEPSYHQAVARTIEEHASFGQEDFVLFSYHGLPVRHIKKSACSVLCQGDTPCPTMNQDNRLCYRAQCYATTHAIAKVLSMDTSHYSVAFQSRLGRTPWIQPYTDEYLSTLRERSIKRLMVVCPSFTADCLETLEEIGMRAKEDWLKLGGTSLELVPCVNNHPAFIDCLKHLVLNKARIC